MNLKPTEAASPPSFPGTFQPPALGGNEVPVKIAGPGHCTLGKDAIEVSGFQPASRALYGLLFFAALVAAVAAVMVFADGDRFWAKVAGLAVLPFAVPVLKGSGKYNEKKPMKLVVPWDNAEVVGDERFGRVLIKVKKVKPSGVIYFHPEGGVAAFMQAVRQG